MNNTTEMIPETYRTAYKNMQKYMWNVGIGGDDWKESKFIYE